MDQRGWVPATAGNISVCFEGSGGGARRRIAITRSGGHKGFLDASAVIEVALDGRSLTEGAKPSAETLLHCQIYRMFPGACAVLHGHSVAGTVLSLLHPDAEIVFTGFELFKAFAGQSTHDTTLGLKLFANDQDIGRLAGVIEPHLAGCAMGYYIRGHGAYVWAPDMNAALARLEALEFLLECELARRQIERPRLESAS